VRAPLWRHPSTPALEAIGCGEFWVVSGHADIEILGDPLYGVSGVQSPVVFSMEDLPVRPTPPERCRSARPRRS
jgi:hypothetical protein